MLSEQVAHLDLKRHADRHLGAALAVEPPDFNHDLCLAAILAGQDIAPDRGYRGRSRGGLARGSLVLALLASPGCYDEDKALRQSLPASAEGRPGAQRFRRRSGEPAAQRPRGSPGAVSPCPLSNANKLASIGARNPRPTRRALAAWPARASTVTAKGALAISYTLANRTTLRTLCLGPWLHQAVRPYDPKHADHGLSPSRRVRRGNSASRRIGPVALSDCRWMEGRPTFHPLV